MNLLSSTYKREDAKPLDCQRALLYDASRHENHFCHHGHICAFQGRLYAMWSNGREGEGEIGQRILYAVSSDGLAWSEPATLLSDGLGPACRKTLVPAGWLVRDDCLTAYAGAFSYVFPRRKKWDESGLFRYGVQCTGTSLLAMTSTDGLVWSKPLDLHVPLCPQYGAAAPTKRPPADYRQF